METNIMSSFLSNNSVLQRIVNKLSDKKYQTNMMKELKSNPFSILEDPDIMNMMLDCCSKVIKS